MLVGANVPLYWDTKANFELDVDVDNPTGQEIVDSLSEFKYMLLLMLIPYVNENDDEVPNVYDRYLVHCRW